MNKMNKNNFVLVFGFCMVLFLLSFVSPGSASSLGIFKQGECIQLVQTCPDCSYNNISAVLYPNSTVALSSVLMQKDDTFYNYTFCDTATPGMYTVNGYGDLVGTKSIWVYDFTVTPTGEIQNSFLNNTVFLIGIFLAILFLIFGFYNHNAVFVFISSVLFIVVGVYTMIYGFNDITNLYTRAVSVVLLGTGVIFMMWSGYEMTLDS